jgi:hypothetical protein
MFEWHGWIAIHSSEEDQIPNKQFLSHLEQDIASLHWSSGMAEVRAFNGTHFLYLHGNTNRFPDWHKQIQKILNDIVVNASGSHGIIYWCDDELQNQTTRNCFHVIALRGSQISTYLDPFLGEMD